MQQETRAVRCGNSLPQEGMGFVGGENGFRLFNLAGLIWPLSMDRLLSRSLSLSLFFLQPAKMRVGIRSLDLCRNRRRLLSVSRPFPRPHPRSQYRWMCACVKLETQTSVHANLTRPSVRHSTPWPTKKELPYLPPLPCHSLVLPAAAVSRRWILRGMEERKSDVGCFGKCYVYT